MRIDSFRALTLDSVRTYPRASRGVPLQPATTVKFGFIQHCRPLHNGVQRPTASDRGGRKPESRGYAIMGHHGLLLPLVAAALDAGWLRTSRRGK